LIFLVGKTVPRLMAYRLTFKLVYTMKEERTKSKSVCVLYISSSGYIFS